MAENRPIRMKFSKRLAITVPVTALVVIALGFLLVYPGGRRIAGDYRLMRDADHTTYQLDDTAQPENQLGNVGSVVRIGWDSRRIVVKRLASPTKGTPWSHEAGWVVIEVDRKRTSATMTDPQLKKIGGVSSIVTYTPDSAYQRAHWW
jgi:hypothetical protein